jgi:O-acetyl-ADP-ribose deacetylase (regulator of RNase III)
MKIYLLDINKDMTDAWQKYFDPLRKVDNIEIVNEDFATFMDKHPNIEAVVSPANSFGLMDGGYDKAITDYFGEGLMKYVQKSILMNWYGEQPVGTSITVPIHNRVFNTVLGSKCCVLIHTPSMRTPEIIKDSRIIYQCMRTTLIEAKRQKVKSIVIPAFGGLTGKVPCDEIAKMMFLAYKQISNRPCEISWGYAWHIARELM